MLESQIATATSGAEERVGGQTARLEDMHELHRRPVAPAAAQDARPRCQRRGLRAETAQPLTGPCDGSRAALLWMTNA